MCTLYICGGNSILSVCVCVHRVIEILFLIQNDCDQSLIVAIVEYDYATGLHVHWHDYVK